jgi:hypothetical protein
VRRYTCKGIEGPTSVISFRVPQRVRELFDQCVLEAPDLASQTEAGQDAIVKWIMLEEHARAQAPEVPHETAPEANGAAGT